VIAFRAPKDPRDLKILDPACGSGHFLLYAYDLLEVIYLEAWADSGGPLSSQAGRNLRADYPSQDDLRSDLPRLILRHNLFGIDIDLRAAQITALALWLRAQRAYQALGLGASDRPPIRRSNIVCAEPMPGETKLLDEVLTTLDPPVLRELVSHVWTVMDVAAEAGSLLKIEVEIQDALAEAEARAGPLFAAQDFWVAAESSLLAAVRRCASATTGNRPAQRQLFVEDAEQGIAFLDTCRLRFDVVLMNPPFGEPSLPSRVYIERAYPRTKHDLYAAFVERGLEWLSPRGLLGAITSRTGFFLTTFQRWREEILLEEARPLLVADLGYGVMQGAMVEAAAYCLERR
jgi:hypothetical protein